MTYITAEEFKTRFPEFAAFPDETVDDFITESNDFVDDTWPLSVRARAQGLYVAHSIKVTYAATNAGAGAAQSLLSAKGVQSFKIDDLNVSFAQKHIQQQLSENTLETTDYGRQFIYLQKRYFGGGVWAR